MTAHDVSELIAALRALAVRLADDTHVFASCADERELLESAQAVISLRCGNGRIYEHLEALRLREAGKDAHHRPDSYGPDLVVREDGETRLEELKTSTVKKKNGYRSNWNYEIVGSGDYTLRVDAVLADVKRKMGGGVIVLEAREHGTARQTNRYELDWRFFGALLARYLQAHPTTTKLNLGSVRCPSCLEYHRVLHLVSWNNTYVAALAESTRRNDRKPWKILTSGQWKDVLKTVASACHR